MSVEVPLVAQSNSPCSSTYGSFATSMKRGWCGWLVTGTAGVATLAGPIVGVFKGLVKKNPEKYGADYMSKVICHAGSKFSPINGIMQEYIKDFGKYVLPAIPLITIAGGVFWRAHAQGGAKGCLTRVWDQAKNVPWKQVAYAVTTTALAVYLTVWQNDWTSAVNGAYPDTISADPSGHVLMTLAIGWATLFTQSAAAVFDQPLISLGTTLGMVGLSIANATFLEHTAWVCHTTREVYEGLAIGIGIPVALCLSHQLGRIGLWTGSKAISVAIQLGNAVIGAGRTTCGVITNLFGCCRRGSAGRSGLNLSAATTDLLTVVDTKCSLLGLINQSGKALANPVFDCGYRWVRDVTELRESAEFVQDLRLTKIMKFIRKTLDADSNAEITAETIREASLLNNGKSDCFLEDPVIMMQAHTTDDGSQFVAGETYSRELLEKVSVPEDMYAAHTIIAGLLGKRCQ